MAERLGPPPARLPAVRKNDIVTVGPDELVWRIYRRGGPHATAWDELRPVGPLPHGRFDHHVDGTARAILYAAAGRSVAVATAFAEAFQVTRTIDRRARAPWLVAFRPARAVRLLDLTSGWATRAGANLAIAAGPHAASQAWARAIHEVYDDLDGVAYASSCHPPGRNVALFERAADSLPAAPEFHRALADAEMTVVLRQVAATLGYALV